MLAWLTRKRWSKNLDSLGVRHCKSGARAQRLGVESLEARCLLTAAPFVGPVLPTSVFHTDGPAFVSAPATLAATLASAQEAASQSVNAFGLDLFKQLQKSDGGDGNMFVSPFSISTALAMVYAGARGDTAAQIAKVLHFDSNQQQIAHDFGVLLTSMNRTNYSDVGFKIADSLWTQDGMNVLSDFLNTLQNDFQSGSLTVDFANHPDAARQTINDWVAAHTNQKIQNLLPEGSINHLTNLVLTNAIYFNAHWISPFERSNTFDADFTLNSGEHALVSTMHRTWSYPYMQRDGFQVLEIPYGGQLAMDVLLPTGELDLSVDRLPSDLKSWFSALTYGYVDVSLPKFAVTSEFDLSATLGAMGMPSAFGDTANFSGISDAAGLKVSQVAHQVSIDVDETGTVAVTSTGSISVYSVTKISGYVPPPPIEFNADHPFMYMVRDVVSGTVLFMGQESSPPSKGTPPPATLASQSTSGAPVSSWSVVGSSDAPNFAHTGGHQDVFVGPVPFGTLIYGSLIMMPPKPLTFVLTGHSLTAVHAAQTGTIAAPLGNSAAPLVNAAEGPAQQPLLAPPSSPVSATVVKKLVASSPTNADPETDAGDWIVVGS